MPEIVHVPSGTPAARKTWANRVHVAVRLVAAFVVVLAIYLIARRLDGQALATAFRTARVDFLALAAACGVMNLWSKAWLWRVTLPSTARIRLRSMFRYTVAAYAVSALTPARAGEVLRIWALRRHHAITYAESAAATLTEKYLDVLALLAFAAPLPWLVPPLPIWTGRMVAGLAAGSAMVLLVAMLAFRLGPTTRLATFLLKVRVVQRPTTLMKALAISALASAFDLGTLWFSLRAVDIRFGFGGAAFVLLVTNLAIAVPTTPGNVGALEMGAVLGLVVLGVPQPKAVALSLLYHAVQLIPLFALAALDLRVVVGWFSRRSISSPSHLLRGQSNVSVVREDLG